MFRTDTFTLRGGLHYSRPAMMLDMVNDICAELKEIVPRNSDIKSPDNAVNKKFLKYCNAALYSNNSGGYSLTAENGINVFDIVSKFSRTLVYNRAPPGTTNAVKAIAESTIKSVTTKIPLNDNMLSDSRLITNADALSKTNIAAFDKSGRFSRKWKSIFKITRVELKKFTMLDGSFYPDDALAKIAAVDTDRFVDNITTHIKQMFLGAFGSANSKPLQLTQINLFSLSVILFHTAILSYDIIAVWMSLVAERNMIELLEEFCSRIRGYKGNNFIINRRIAVAIEYLATSICGQALISNKDASFGDIFPAIYKSVSNIDNNNFGPDLTDIINKYIKNGMRLSESIVNQNSIAVTTDVYYNNHLRTIAAYLKDGVYVPRSDIFSKITNAVSPNLYLTLNRDEVIEILRFPNRVSRLRIEDASLVRDGAPHLVTPTTRPALAPSTPKPLPLPSMPMPAPKPLPLPSMPMPKPLPLPSMPMPAPKPLPLPSMPMPAPKPLPLPSMPMPAPKPLPVYTTIPDGQPATSNNNQSYDTDAQVRYSKAKRAAYDYWNNATYGHTRESLSKDTIYVILDKMWRTWERYDNLPSKDTINALQNDMINSIPVAASAPNPPGEVNTPNPTYIISIPNSSTRYEYTSEEYERYKKAKSEMIAAWRYAIRGLTKASFNDETLKRQFNNIWQVWAQYDKLPPSELMRALERDMFDELPNSNDYSQPIKQGPSEELERSQIAAMAAWESAMVGQTNPSSELLAAAYNAVWKAWELHSPLPSPEFRKSAENELYRGTFKQASPRPVSLDRNSNDAKERSKKAGLAVWDSAMAGQINPSSELLAATYDAVWKAWELYSPLPSPEDRKRAEDSLLNRLKMAQLQAAELQAAQIRLTQTMPAQIGVAQAMPAQLGVAQAMPAQIGVAQAMPAKESLTNRYRSGNSVARKSRTTTYNTYGTQTRSGFTDLDLRRVLY